MLCAGHTEGNIDACQVMISSVMFSFKPEKEESKNFIYLFSHRETVEAHWFVRMVMFGGWLELLVGELAVQSLITLVYTPKWLSF